MQKVDGVERVRVSLKEGLTILDLKAGNSITLARLRDIIKNNGFVSKEAAIVARGSRSGSGANEAFEVSGTHERLPVGAKIVADGAEQWRFTTPSPR
jgi:hypothetical protein